MRFESAGLRLAMCAAALVDLSLSLAGAQVTNESVYPIDLPTVLRLVGARNLDIQIAREQLNEAEANRRSALEQFFPWVAPGFLYHRRDGVAQAVPSGVISDAHFQSFSPGAALTAQMSLGDAIYNSLAAKQLVKVSDQALATQGQDAILAAAQGYFDLLKAKALAGVVNEAIQISQDYQQQLHAVRPGRRCLPRGRTAGPGPNRALPHCAGAVDRAGAGGRGQPIPGFTPRSEGGSGATGERVGAPHPVPHECLDERTGGVGLAIPP